MAGSMAPDGTDAPPRDGALDTSGQCAAIDAEELLGRAREASNLLKALAHEGRLMIMCHLTSGEKSPKTAMMRSESSRYRAMRTGRKVAPGQSLAAREIGMADRTPKARAS